MVLVCLPTMAASGADGDGGAGPVSGSITYSIKVEVVPGRFEMMPFSMTGDAAVWEIKAEVSDWLCEQMSPSHDNYLSYIPVCASQISLWTGDEPVQLANEFVLTHKHAGSLVARQSRCDYQSLLTALAQRISRARFRRIMKNLNQMAEYESDAWPGTTLEEQTSWGDVVKNLVICVLGFLPGDDQGDRSGTADDICEEIDDFLGVVESLHMRKAEHPSTTPSEFMEWFRIEYPE